MINTIYILWFQGFDTAPELVKQCVTSWKYYNPDWNIVLLDTNTLTQYVNLEMYIPDIKQKNIDNTALSDVVRCILLNEYGGLWVDATTFCNKPLNDWLPACIHEGFFAFNKPGPDRLLSSWFLYSEPHTYILDKWFHKTVDYYTRNNTSHTYFWFHYLFGDLYASDPIFKEIWDKVPKHSANGIGPHYVQEKGMFTHVSKQIKLNIDSKITPLYKLTLKCAFLHYDETKLLYYLYSTIKNTTRPFLQHSQSEQT
jgi:mannosyltransferase OCH1-like enzyme